MLSSRFAGIPISSSTIDGSGVPQLLNRGEQTMRAVTGSGGRLHFGMVAGIKSERWPTSNRNPWPDCLGIRTDHHYGDRVHYNCNPWLLCVYSTAGLQRARLGAFERYGEVLSGAFIALVGVALWLWPVL